MNGKLFKEPHDEAVHKNSYKSKLYESISASLSEHLNARPLVSPEATEDRSTPILKF